MIKIRKLMKSSKSCKSCLKTSSVYWRFCLKWYWVFPKFHNFPKGFPHFSRKNHENLQQNQIPPEGRNDDAIVIDFDCA